MWTNWKKRLWDWRGVVVATPSMAILVMLLRLSGILEPLEWSLYDQYMRLRPAEPKSQRVAIVGLDEADMKYIGQGYVSDQVYADLLSRLIAMEPRVIGLDIYRDLPYEPGHAELTQIFTRTENLIGIEKVVGDRLRQTVDAPPELKQAGRVGANDLLPDEDSTIRRALLVQKDEKGESFYAFGLYLAMLYLQAEGIGPEVIEGTDNWWKFGQVVFKPFQSNDGGYIRAEDEGYQILLNYQGPNGQFDMVSYRDVLEGRVASDWAKDRLILIGAVGESFQDLFPTPFTQTADQRMSGVEIHANLANQIIDSGLENRPLIKSWSEPGEWLWIFIWSGVGATLTWTIRSTRHIKRFLLQQIGLFLVLTGGLVGMTYLAFLQGWWLPVIPAVLAMSAAAVVITAYIARTAADIRKTFGRYLSDEIVATLLESPEGLKMGGERRKITILTSDLRGFTSLSERLSPEEVVKVLNFYLSQMADVITDYQGTIDEFMGDGILVLFGAPTQRNDDATRAVACAVAMQLKMVNVNQKLESWGLNSLEMGIGINTGEVVVGNLGSEKRTKYGVVGSQVNLAYRIEGYTTGGQIIISETSLQEAGETLVEVEGKKLVQPKGVKRPINIYEVSGIAGNYQLYIKKEDEVFLPVDEAVPLKYTILEGKHVGENTFSGRLIEISTRGGLIQTENGEESLPVVLTNIKLNLKSSRAEMREDVYAKVMERPAAPNQFYIRFTSRPPAIEAEFEQTYAAINR